LNLDSENSELALPTEYAPNRVSVIIPAFNYGHFLRQCLDSVLQQNCPDVEIIVVDDGSTDDTPEVVESYRGRVKYLRRQNLGVSAARNKGLLNCTGEWILFLDADDLLGPDVISSQLHFLRNQPNVSITVCRSTRFKKFGFSGKPVSSGLWHLPKDNLEVHLCHFNIAPPHAFLTHRTVITQIGFFDSAVNKCEDYDFWLRAALKGHIPQYNPTGMVYYRCHPGSASFRLRNQCQVDMIMHHRLSIMLDSNPQFPEGRRLEGLLAFVAGVLVTALRLHHFGLPNAEDLLNLADARIEEMERIGCSMGVEGDLLVQLLILRVIRYTEFPSLKKFNSVNMLRRAMQNIFHSGQISQSKFSIAVDGFRAYFSHRPDGRLERSRLRNYALSALAAPLKSLVDKVDQSRFLK
jgi:glycosyltransferase involved in cell wall biosynthesis